MNSESESNQIRAFIKRYGAIRLFSTGATPVDISDELYNVHESTEDPKSVDDHIGRAWKALFNRVLDLPDASCYVTDPLPQSDSSHPDFSVGGHMTTKSSGIVEQGGTTYLMPLCYWHNSTSRDGIAFHHTETRMLKLSGFMEGDTALTFSMRMPDKDPYTLLYFDPHRQEWSYKKLNSDGHLHSLMKDKMFKATGVLDNEFALVERKGDMFYIIESRIAE